MFSIIQSFNHSIYIVLNIFLLVTISTVKAQIIIKEKVEIKPGGEDIQSDYPLSSFDPCGSYPTEEYHQVVYSCSMYPIEPYQQLFPFQGGGSNSTFNSNRYYQIEIIEGSDYAYMEKVAYQDSFGVFHPGEYLGSYLTGIRGSELSGSGNYIALFDPNNPAIQRSGTYIRENSSLYYIHFNSYEQTEADVTVKITDLDSSVVTYWYTKIVNPQLIIANQQLENDTVSHYYSKDVSIKLNNTKFPCLHTGYGGCPPDNVTFNIEITQGQQYGIIKNSETKETNTSFTGLSWEEINHITFTYYANGIQPDSTAIVRIRHSSSDAELIPMEYEFTVKRNTIPPPSEGGAIYIQLDKKQVMPSDTVDIYLRWINELGDTLEFAPIQRFQVELAEGAEYGRLIDVESGQEGDNFSDAGRELKLIIENEIQKDLAKITIVAQCDLLIWGGRTPITGSVKIKEREEEATERNKEKEPITPEFIIVGDHLIGVEEIIINKTPIVVEIIPEEISAGDTARIVVKKRQADGTIVEFPAEQQFEIGMLEGCLLGKLSSGVIDTNYINNATQPIYFVADHSADSGLVKIRIGLKDSSTTGNRSNKGQITTEAGEYCFLNAFESVIYKDAEVKVENVIEILLGETKYFGVKKKTATGELKIEEIKTNYGDEPKFPVNADGWEWLKTDVWGNEPVTKIEGEKLGVYWEKEKPVWEGTTKKGNLAEGLIRLVGRYWEEGKAYKVKLTAHTTTGDQASIEIEVKKPAKLGPDKPLGVEYINFTDVFGHPDTVNEYCIREAGREGIPPQLPKAQAFKESIPKFAPNYRYEPWTDLEFHNSPKLNKQFFSHINTFVVTENSMGGNKPSTLGHSNVGDANYPDEPTTAAKIIARDLRSRYWVTKAYSCVNESGKDITKQFWVYYKKDPKRTKKEEDNAINDAINLVKRDLMNGLLKRYNFIAQSRIVASYNPFQQTYYNAVEWELYNFRYTNSDFLPEMLNELEHQFKTYVSRIKKVFMENKAPKIFINYVDLYGNNWPLGYEGTWDLYEDTYNHNDRNYHKAVMNYYKLFEPKKEN